MISSDSPNRVVEVDGRGGGVWPQNMRLTCLSSPQTKDENGLHMIKTHRGSMCCVPIAPPKPTDDVMWARANEEKGEQGSWLRFLVFASSMGKTFFFVPTATVKGDFWRAKLILNEVCRILRPLSQRSSQICQSKHDIIRGMKQRQTVVMVITILSSCQSDETLIK